MEITDTSNHIRQRQPGQFRRPEDGKEPFAHVNDKKLESPEEKKKCSVYIDSENVVTFEEDIRVSLPKLFDFDAGVKFNTETTNDTNKKEKLSPQYDKTGKAEIMSKQESLVDQWA